MGIMQLLNIVLFWLFFGLCTSYLAKKRGRHQAVWFLIGLFLGIFGIALLFILPKVIKKGANRHAPLKTLMPKKSESWLKIWYYLDPAHTQQGPLEFPDLIQKWKEKSISERSYIWGEGMKEWKRLSDLPEIIQEIDQT